MPHGAGVWAFRLKVEGKGLNKPDVHTGLISVSQRMFSLAILLRIKRSLFYLFIFFAAFSFSLATVIVLNALIQIEKFKSEYFD